jgi:hypothetical protein
MHLSYYKTFHLEIYQEQSSEGRSQWPRDLRHELSSPALTLRSWGRIPLETWMFVRVDSVFVLSCV